MDVLAPSPGTAAPGNLYVDLQSRTLWLGVDPAVDPAGSVLVSDMMGLQAEIDGALVEAKNYTDTVMLTRAPTVHTHTSSQVTDFATAVQAVVNSMPALSFTQKMIMMYSGSIADVGVGPLAGWQLCDGTNGTPDLRDKFVIGAGNKVVGTTPTQTSFDTTAGQGGHNHTVTGTAISIAQMPAHDHTPGTGGESTDHAHYVSGYTSVNGNHGHSTSYTTSPGDNPSGGNTNISTDTGNSGGGNQITVNAAGDHQHTVNFWSGGRNVGHTHAIYSQGGGQEHTHTIIGGGGVHQHNITANQLRETVPYFALAFIMKL